MKKFIFSLLVAILLGLSAGLARAQEPTIAPGQFAFFDDNNNLWLIQGDLKNPIFIAHPSPNFTGSRPRFSHDGRLLAYCTYPNGVDAPTSIYFVDTLTLQKQPPILDGSCDFDWSPLGSELIFAAATPMGLPSPGQPGIRAYSLETQATRVLFTSDDPISGPKWSPDGKFISYFDFCFECIGQFHTFELSTGQKHDWSTPAWHVGPDVSWSPDGKSLAFDESIDIYTMPGETHGLQVAPSDGKAPVKIFTSPGKAVLYPLWSPDGARIAFVIRETISQNNTLTYNSELVTIDPNGANLKSLGKSTGTLRPQAWSADSRYLFFTNETRENATSLPQKELLLTDVQTAKAVWTTSVTGYDSAAASILPLPLPEPTPAAPPVALSTQSGLLYVMPDFALAFYHPQSGYNVRLTPGRSGTRFSISPDQKTILFGQHILTLTIDPAGIPAVTSLSATLPADFYQLRWSPDSQKFGYATLDGHAWVEDLAGQRQELNASDAPPDWSPDGRWMAYCDKTGAVWLSDSGKPATQVAAGKYCSATWSPASNSLLYTLSPEQDYINFAQGTAYLLDPQAGQPRQVAQGISGAIWSPDGKFISLSRIIAMGASSYSYDLYALNPAGGPEVKLDEFYTRMAGLQGWIKLQDGYQVGTVRFQSDPAAHTRLADMLFDATRDGRVVLTGSGDYHSIQLVCTDLQTNTSHPLITADQSDTPGAAMPGIFARLSPDGKWAVAYDYNGSDVPGWIGQCAAGDMQPLPGHYEYDNIFFSPDSQWFISQQTQAVIDQDWKIYLHDLANGGVKEIPAGADTGAAWLRLPQQPVIPATATPAPAVGIPVPPASAASIDAFWPWLVGLCCGLPLLVLAIFLLLRRRPTRNARLEQTQPTRVVKLAPAKVQPPRQTIAPPPAAPEPVPALEPQPAPPSAAEIEAIYQAAIRDLRAGSVDQGLAGLKTVLAHQPENANAWFWLGSASVGRKDYRMAERCFLQARKYGHSEAARALDWLKANKK